MLYNDAYLTAACRVLQIACKGSSPPLKNFLPAYGLAVHVHLHVYVTQGHMISRYLHVMALH